MAKERCDECIHYKAIDGSTGHCKVHRAERHVVPINKGVREIINGWPVVKCDSSVCGDVS